jgi:lipopolysaccharide transport system permease protein
VVSELAGIGEIWEYRGLIKKLAITDLKVRYKNSVLGILWSLLQPLLMFIVLLIVFTGLMINRSIENYPLFLLLGIIGWGFFDKATGFGLGSIVGKPQLVKKIYFPREVLVISACLTALMMSLIEFVVFGVFLLGFNLLYYFSIYGSGYVIPTWAVVVFPIILIIEFMLALGVSMAIASLNVIWRDVQWIWPVIMQTGFFLTPIMYSMDIFKGVSVSWILKYNPMTAVLDSMRFTLINTPASLSMDMLYAAVFALVAIVVGWLIFYWLEPRFGEEV